VRYIELRHRSNDDVLRMRSGRESAFDRRGAPSFGQSQRCLSWHLPFPIFSAPHATTRGFLTAMLLLRHVSRQRRDACRHCIRGILTNARGSTESNQWAGEWDDAAARKAAWAQKAGRIRSGAQQSMLSVLEERGFVKDIAG
jgi:hypothetical protein